MKHWFQHWTFVTWGYLAIGLLFGVVAVDDLVSHEFLLGIVTLFASSVYMITVRLNIKTNALDQDAREFYRELLNNIKRHDV